MAFILTIAISIVLLQNFEMNMCSRMIFVLYLISIILQYVNATEYTTKSTNRNQNVVPPHGKCEPIQIPLCKDISYNETMMPNILNHQTQEDAGMEVHQFFPLIKVQCSEQLKWFLCVVYVPVCTVLQEAIPPCQSLCNQARTGCESLMNKFGFKWPDRLDCEKFPVSGLCILRENQTEPQPPVTTKVPDNGGGRGMII